jgi:ATP-dependent DNA helicase DinG
MSPAAFIDDPNWEKFIPERFDAAKQRHLPTHDDCAKIDVAAVQNHLRAGGTLGAMKGYEERPGQIDMTGAIAAAFNAREHLAIEAGTGVGKSLAYLVPSILWSWTNDTPVIVSTATRNLQSQLISSDIPRAVKILGGDAAKFKVALLKGRTNYLCLRAVSEFFASGYWTMSEEEKELMPAFIDWLQHTKDGDLDSYEGIPRAQLSCPGDECSGRRCPYYTRCFVYKARKAAAEAHLVVANHALVLAEATAPGSGILPGYGRLVMDEAHNLESIATDYLSLEFSLPALMHILNRLSKRGKGRRRGGWSSGTLASVERQFQKGAFKGNPAGAKVMRAISDAAGITVRIVNAANELADVAARLLRPSKDRDICRYRVGEDGRRAFTLHGLFKPYELEDWREEDLKRAQTKFEAALAAMVNLLHDLRDTLDNAVPEGELNYLADLSSQVSGAADSLVAFANETNFVLLGDKATHAYWVERVRQAKRPSYIRLVAAPLSVADDLKKIFYDVKDSVVLCSATLRVGNDFKYMAKRLGMGERFQFLTATSPFDYFRQSLVLAPDCLPDPSAHAADYAAALAAILKDLFAITQGRALVLFTSYEMMKSVAAQAAGPLLEAGIKLLVQGEGLSREAMTRQLKETSNVVLFGAQSFWEGVDVAGEALSCVVLARLPFAQVGDPIIEARAEKIEREGGSSFRDYSLPEAVIKFRQGFGRLIRTKSDRGVVIVSDPRLVTKNYGALFRKSIPASVHTVSDAADLLSRVSAFFAEF